MKKTKLLPILAATCCSFALAGATTAIIPTYHTPTQTASASSNEILLNGCNAVGSFWCNAGATVNTDAAYIEEGSGSIAMSFAGWAPMNIDLGTTSVTDYASIKMTVWSTQAVKLLAGNINFNDDPNCILADLVVGKNEVVIPKQKLIDYNLTSKVIAPYVSGDCVLYVDNIVGILQEEGTVSQETLLNGCNSADGFWCNAGATVNADAAYIEEGSGSIAMSFAGWAPMNINWGTNSITDYDYVKMTVWSTKAVKLLAGNINFNDDPDCILADLAIGRNDVLISAQKLVDYNLTSQIVAPYVSGDCILYVDNIVGIKTIEAGAVSPNFNSCDVADATWIDTNGSYALESTIMTEGSASIRLVLGTDNYFALSLLDANNGNAPLTTEQLLSFDYLALDVNNVTSGNVGLYLYNALAATLAPGWNTVAISKTTIQAQITENPSQFTDGKFYFSVNGDCTLLVDNVRGMSQADLNGSYEDFSNVGFSAATAGDPIIVEFGSDDVSVLSNAQAQDLALPEGFTGNVMSVSGSNANGKGVLLDFSALQIPTSTIESITFRIYFPDDAASNGYPMIRIRNQADNDNVVNYGVETHAGSWYDFVLEVGSTFAGSHDFSHLSVGGYLDKFEFALRTGNTAPFYIDSISYRLTTDVDDTDVPVISYGGPSTVYHLAKEGTPFSISAQAYDKTQGEIAVQQSWSAGAVNGDGSLNPGTHTLTLTATDAGRNTATQTITVVGVAYETNAPVINLPTTTLTLPAGTKPQLNPSVTDDSDAPITLTTTWSSGALNNKKQLNAGTHTCTITATDLSGNTATKTLTVTVVGTDVDEWDNVVDENTPVTYTFSANGGSGSSSVTTVANGSTITLPECTFDAPSGYYFAGWAIGSASGEVKAPGETVTLNGNTEIFAVWTESHTHSYDGEWQKDANGHWKQCSCGENGTVSAHTDDDNNHLCDDCDYKVSDCDDADKDHDCDICGETVGTHAGTANSHICEYCNQPASDCDDADKNHACDICGEKLTACEDNDSDHLCDTCGETLSVCEDTDGDDDHDCDICGTKMGDCEDADNDDDHLCDTCGQPCGDHVFDSEWQKDASGHWKNCNCGEKDTVSAHTDDDDNHLCDTCNYTVSDCDDADNDHTCDICGETLSVCEDNDSDHLCDTCGETLSVCEDDEGDDDHDCDVCGTKMGACEDDDSDNDHLCDICGQPCGDHVFDSEWHKNDALHWKNCNCGYEGYPSPHNDADNDHLCDDCNHKVSDCADENGDGVCDTCATELPSSGNTETTSSGCGGAISGVSACMTALALAFVAIKKKRK